MQIAFCCTGSQRNYSALSSCYPVFVQTDLFMLHLNAVLWPVFHKRNSLGPKLFQMLTRNPFICLHKQIPYLWMHKLEMCPLNYRAVSNLMNLNVQWQMNLRVL